MRSGPQQEAFSPAQERRRAPLLDESKESESEENESEEGQEERMGLALASSIRTILGQYIDPHHPLASIRTIWPPLRLNGCPIARPRPSASAQTSDPILRLLVLPSRRQASSCCFP